MKYKIASFGSVSTAESTPDIMSDLIWELRHLGHRAKELTIIENRYNTAIEGEFGEDDAYFKDELAKTDINRLCDMLNEHSPSYGLFGETDECYGFYLDDIDIRFDGLRVDDTDKIPSKYIGEVIYINDHGNTTLFWKSARKLTEIWAIV